MESKFLFWGIIIFLLGSLGIGIWASYRVKGDSDNFLVAGRGLSLPLAAATVMAQSVDSNSTLGNTDLTAEFGFWAGASLPLGLALCLFLTGLFYAKPLNRMGLTTLPDFYRVKYGRLTERIASVIMVLSFAFLLAGNLVAGGYLFESFLGLSYNSGVIAIALLIFAYTVSGGLFAVAYTDVVQVGIALVGSLALIGFVAFNFGLEAAPGMGPLALEQLTDPASGAVINWATLLALGIGDIVAIDFMARVFAADSPETAQRACFIGSAGTVIIGIPFSMVALSAGSILDSVATVPDGPVLFALLKSVAPPLLSLLVVAAIMAASLSTGDGAMLGTASVIAHNIIGVQRGSRSEGGGDQLLNLTRAMALVMAVLGTIFAIQVPQTGVLLLLAFDLGFAGLVVPLTGGLFWPKSTRQGALACIITGSATRLLFFVLMPTMFGAENSLLYFPNSWLTADFDGFPTLISPLVGLAFFIGVSYLTQPPIAASVADQKSEAEQTVGLSSGNRLAPENGPSSSS